ncbi:hypothetical protein [Anabaena sp. CS-542/02]|nr:hypothetical protein [Anabaena sp. CS-542/02]
MFLHHFLAIAPFPFPMRLSKFVEVSHPKKKPFEFGLSRRGTTTF